jgi:ribosomal-protein-alanine acetyltransferase
MARESDALEVRSETAPGGSGAVRIRPAEHRDLAAMALIESRSFSNPWHPQTFRSLISRDRALVLVAEDPEAGVVGYAVSWWVLDQAELANIAVGEEHRGRRIGLDLLDRTLDEMRERGVERIFLEVRMSNEGAHRLYLARGFTQVAVRSDYYRNPREDARILVKRLEPLVPR